MANTTRPVGFKPANIKNASFNWYPVTAAQVFKCGDVVSMDSAGGIVLGDALPIGVAATDIVDPDTGLTKTTAEAGDLVGVWDNPFMDFEAQISTYAATDPYTTRSSAACYDVGGATGVQYINAASSSADTFRVIGLAWEENGKKSIAGSYAKVKCRFNLVKHIFGVIA